MASIARQSLRTRIRLGKLEIFTSSYPRPQTTRFSARPRTPPLASIINPLRFFSTSGYQPSKEKPQSFPTSGFEIIPADIPAAEEQISDYSPIDTTHTRETGLGKLFYDMAGERYEARPPEYSSFLLPMLILNAETKNMSP
ncbi:uncharacterized protein N7446_013265 [Penicillium canescens]|uniref:uncharacterized protein n=1 Tax=Penicillium canescens TaxID=5083 RepID=UPI0026DEF112|nr:uncharacterized protein N7446_013265 [Penicillium canescens]KAJ6042199.1 hypothetical protein N7446_013265 [Penicillium canescens]